MSAMRKNEGLRVPGEKPGRKKGTQKNSLMLALAKLKQSRGGKGQRNEHNYDDIFDEINCYIERTLQLLWLFYKVGLFTQTDEIGSLPFRVKHQAKDHFRLTMVKLRHRLKVSTFLVLQLASDTALVEKVQGMHEHQLLQLKVALLDALVGNEFTVQALDKAERDEQLRGSQATSLRSGGVRASQATSGVSQGETQPDEAANGMDPH